MTSLNQIPNIPLNTTPFIHPFVHIWSFYVEFVDHKNVKFAGDILYVNWGEVLSGATAVISTLGGFGSEEQMQRIDSEANIIAIPDAKEYGKTLMNNDRYLSENRCSIHIV